MDTTQAPPDGGHGHRAGADADHIGNMGRYIYQIRNMLAWFLVFWLASVAAAVGVGIWLGHQASQSAVTSSTSGCQQSIIQSC